MAEYKNVLEELAAQETLEDKIENMDKSINTELNKLVDEVRNCCYVDGYDATTEECIGTMVSRFLGWDGNAIMEIAFNALEDSNFHGLNAELQKTYNDWAKHRDLA